MGQKISEFETIWIENYNGSYFKNQGGEKVYYFLALFWQVLPHLPSRYKG